MSLFHENIKQIIAEVEKFLSETLKKEKIGKKALEHKCLILEKITSFLEENPSMKVVPSQDAISISDDSTMTGGSSKSDEVDDAYIENVAFTAASDLKDPVWSGFLEKKQKKGLFGSAKFQPRWCVIHGGAFYYFAKQDDKKQHGSFLLEGYKFRNAPDLASKKKEKDLCFELFHLDDKKRVYQFMAKSPEDYENIQPFIDSHGQALIEEDIYEEVGGAEQPQPASPVSKVETSVPVEPIEDEVYEDPDSAPQPPPVTPTTLPPPPPPPVNRSPKVPAKAPAEPPPPEPEPVADDVYDDASSVSVSTSSAAPTVPGRNLPPTPAVPPPAVPGRQKRDLPELPPTPTPKKKVKVQITCKQEEDFENKFYGKWDCTGDNSGELSFKRGDMIHVINREFDDKSWWIGELNGKFGLVPKNYLVPAYTLVTS